MNLRQIKTRHCASFSCENAC